MVTHDDLYFGRGIQLERPMDVDRPFPTNGAFGELPTSELHSCPPLDALDSAREM